jgi:N-acyl-D-aspartate/D-glutamate deacylase
MVGASGAAMHAGELDLLIQGGIVVDGTGNARRRADVGIRAGRIAEIGRLAGRPARERLDAEGLVVAPGVVDAHTHYDPQITFDPLASMSSYHGVTSVVAGNCGFSVAPCRSDDRDFVARLFARVEQMHPEAMSAILWDFESFPEFLRARQGRLGINFSCYVGHSNLRRWVMGPQGSERAATPAEIEAMGRLVVEAMEAGAAGLSSSHAPTHLDGDERPVPSRLATRAELSALARAAGSAAAGTIGYLPESAVGGLTPEDEEYLIHLAEVSGLPVIIQGLGGRNKVDAPTATWERAVQFLDRAAGRGTPVYSMLIARPPDRPLRVAPDCFHYLAVPAWNALLGLPHAERLARLRDPAARAELRFAVENYNRDPARGTTTPPPLWSTVLVERVARPENQRWVGRSVEAIATERGVAPADALLDLALAEDLATEFRWRWETEEWSRAVAEAQRDPRMLIGTSDGGAHLARDDGSDWSSWYLRHWVLERALWTLEEGIRRITAVPSALLGLVDRGTLEPGRWADLMIFDPARIDAGRKEFARDFPGGAGRFKAWPEGVRATVVNGIPVIVDGKPTGALPGRVLAPGRA